MFDGNWRTTVNRGLDPIGASLRRAGITADALTVFGIVMAGASGVVIANGWLRVGLLFLVLAGIGDALDGPVAKASGSSSVRGAFFDSVSDRVSDVLLFGGVAWYVASEHPGHLVILPVAVMATAMLVSYMRAKAESLGFDAKGGIMERAERFIVLAIGLVFSEVLIPILWAMLVLTLFTAGQRFVKVWRQASVASGRPAPERRSRRRARVRAARRAQARRRS